MIEESHESLKTKKPTKSKKKTEQKMIEEEQVFVQKIQQQAKQISQMSEPDERQLTKRAAQNLYELTQDLISYLLLDHQEFNQEIQNLLQSLKNFQLSRISHQQIMAYSFWAKLMFIQKKIQNSPLRFDKYIVQKQKQKLMQNFKQGLRSFEKYKNLQKDHSVSS